MKKILILIAFVSLSVSLFATEKNINSKLPDITTINIDGDVFITLINDDNNRIEGVIPDNQLDNFSWTVIDGTTLDIKLKKPLNIDDRNIVSPVKLKIYVSQLNTIRCKRGASIISDNILDVKVLTIELSRNAVVSLPIKCVDLTVDASFSAILTLTGETQFATINCNSAAKINNRGLESESAIVNAYTDGECYVKATKKLAITSKTNARVFYKKSDAIVTESASLLGKISTYE